MPLLRYGNTGAYVYMLQLALTRAGYDPGSIDGVFGAGTRRALIAFQRDRGLNADGIAGTATWAALRPQLTGYTNHRVRVGDTLYRIAAQYGSSILAIETANPGVDPLDLQTGTLLRIPFNYELVPTDIPFCHALLTYCVEGLTVRYPFISARSAGSSVMGRELYVLSTGTGRRRLFINAAHHANEWITTPLTLSYLENYARALSRGGSIGGYEAAELYAAAELVLMPTVDPDGVDLVTEAISPAFYPARYDEAARIAGEYPLIPFPDGWKANILGTDLNLQYPAGWENAREIKFAQGFTGPAPRDYVGPSPLSAPESRATAELTSRQDFAMTLSYHTQGRVIFWQYLDREPPRAEEIGRELAARSGYTLEPTPAASAYAGYKDWFIDRWNRPGYTIEAGFGVNPLPIEQFDRIYAENEPLISYAIFVTQTL